MKLLGWATVSEIPLPEARARDPQATLMQQDPERYRRLIDHLTMDVPALAPWRGGLRAGEVRVILTGQQPALLGGPLYTLYKTMTALEAARRDRATGVPSIAAFWCVGDDTDHDEVAAASWPLRKDPPRRVRDEIPAGGARIGGLPTVRMETALEQLQTDWPDAAAIRKEIDSIRTATLQKDWSSFLRECLLRLAGDEPLLFVDGNDPHVIDAGQPWLAGFLNVRDRLASEMDAQANSVRARGEDPVLSGEEAHRCLFVLDGAGRRVLEGDRLPKADELLAPNVLLRPALQEHLLPIGRVVCGEAEIAYRRYLGPVYNQVGRAPAPLLRRFGATLFPPAWSETGDLPDPVETLEDADQALERWALAGLPGGLLAGLRKERTAIVERLRGLADRLAEVDKSLPQALESSVGKIDYQLGRIEDTVAAKARLHLTRRHPELAHLREFVRPRGRPQERSFTLWTPVLWEGSGSKDELRAMVAAWFDRGELGHALIALNAGKEA